MSTTILAAAIVRKIAWTTPGRSGTPRIVIRASSLARRCPGHRRAEALGIALVDDPGAGRVGERAAHVDRDAIFLGKFDRSRVHDAGAQAGELEHLVVADPVDLPCFRHDPRIGGVDAVDVGVDLAAGGPEHGRQRHGRRIRAAAAQSRDVVVFVDALKSGDDHDLAVAERLDHALGGDVSDACLGVKAVGDEPDLGAGETDRRDAQAADGHGHQGDADLLAGRQQHVHLAGGRILGDLLGQLDQLVGGMPAGRDDDQHLVAAVVSLDRAASRRQDLARIGQARPAEFLNQ